MNTRFLVQHNFPIQGFFFCYRKTLVVLRKEKKWFFMVCHHVSKINQKGSSFITSISWRPFIPDPFFTYAHHMNMIGKEIFPQFTSNILCNRPTLDVIIYNVHLQLSLIDEVQPCHSHMSPYLLLCHLHSLVITICL
jgi:hypothetical protein